MYHDDQCALEAIIAGVLPKMQVSLADKPSAKEAWDSVAAARIGVDRVRRATLQRLCKEWENLSFRPGEQMLELEEADLKTPQPGEQTALVVVPQPSAPQPPASPSAPQQSSSAPRNNNKNRYKNKNRSSAPSSSRPGVAGGFGGFCPFLNPYTGTFQMWPMQPTQGMLGPRPGVPH